MENKNTQLNFKDGPEKGLKRDLETNQLSMIAMGCAIGTGYSLAAGLQFKRQGQVYCSAMHSGRSLFCC